MLCRDPSPGRGPRGDGGPRTSADRRLFQPVPAEFAHDRGHPMRDLRRWRLPHRTADAYCTGGDHGVILLTLITLVALGLAPHNAGFAPPQMPKEVALVLSRGDQTHRVVVTDPDPRRWTPEAGTVTLRGSLPLPADARAAGGGWPCTSRTPRRACAATAGTRSASPTKGSASTSQAAGTSWPRTWRSGRGGPGTLPAGHAWESRARTTTEARGDGPTAVHHGVGASHEPARAELIADRRRGGGRP